MNLPQVLNKLVRQSEIGATGAFVLGMTVFAQDNEEEIFELSPFEVDASKNIGYHAENTLAGSRLNTKVADLAASITVVTAQQMEDTASVDLNDVFRYEANTEGASTYTPSVQSLRNDGVVDANAGFTSGATGTTQSHNTANRIRGIGAPGTTVNYYPSLASVPFDSYNTASVEISRGPNSLLFGMGNPAGIVNQSTNQAYLDKNSNKLSLRMDNNGSFRTSFAFNRGLIENKLAIYGAFLKDDRDFERKPSYDNTERAYGAITYKPFEKTIIRANIESYSNENRRPNTLTPRDAVSDWREGGSWGYDPSTGNLLQTATGVQAGPLAIRSGSPRIDETRAYIESLPSFDASLWNGDQTQYNGVNIYGGSALTDRNSILYTPGLALGNDSRPKMQIANGEVVSWNYFRADRYRKTYGTPENPTGNAPLHPASEADDVFGDPLNAAAYDTSFSNSDFNVAASDGLGSYRYPGITDKSIYDWENINAFEMNFGSKDATTYNIELEQRLLDDLTLSAGYFRQDFETTTNYTVSQLNTTTIYADTNTHLPDGSENPYFGQAYVYDFDPDQFVTTNLNESSRAMLAWTPDFTEKDGWQKWLGSHQVVGLISKNSDLQSFKRKRWFITSSEEEAKGAIFLTRNPNDNLDGTPTGYKLENRGVQRMYYLSNPSDVANGSVTKSSGSFDTSSYTGDMQYYNWDSQSWETMGMTQEFIDHSAHTGRSEREVESTSLGITSHLWSDRIILTLGTRTDDYKARATTTGAIENADGTVTPGMSNPEKWVDGYYQTETVFNRWNNWDELSGSTSTAGVVFRPFDNRDNINNEFLSSLGFSYNKSDNFNPPEAAQVDAFGTPLPKPTGEGEDWGVQFTLFEEKLFARLNWFKATNENERTNPGTSVSRLTNNVDTTLFRNWARTIALINMGQDPRGDNFDTDLSPAEEDAVQAASAEIWNLPYTYYDDIGSIYATRSAVAEGMEIQIVYNPIQNWTFKFSGGKQETKYSDVLKEFDAWYAVRNPVWQAARGADYLLPEYQDLLTYTTQGGREVSLESFLGGYGFNNNVYIDNPDTPNPQAYYDVIVAPQYAIARDLEGQAAPGQRKYSASMLTNYQFTEGKFRGVSVGGSLRWEDKAVIGYYGKINPGSGSTDLTLSDVTRPIYDDANTRVDLWVGYSRDLNEKMSLNVKLNVVDALEDGHLQTVSVNYDGSPSSYRIVDPRQFILTTTLNF